MAAQYVTFLMYKLNEAKMPQTSFISDNLRIRGKFKATSSSRNDFIVMKTIFSPLLEFSFKSVMSHVFVVVNRQQVLFIILWKRMWMKITKSTWTVKFMSLTNRKTQNDPKWPSISIRDDPAKNSFIVVVFYRHCINSYEKF